MIISKTTFPVPACLNESSCWQYALLLEDLSQISAGPKHLHGFIRVGVSPLNADLITCSARRESAHCAQRVTRTHTSLFWKQPVPFHLPFLSPCSSSSQEQDQTWPAPPSSILFSTLSFTHSGQYQQTLCCQSKEQTASKWNKEDGLHHTQSELCLPTRKRRQIYPEWNVVQTDFISRFVFIFCHTVILSIETMSLMFTTQPCHFDCTQVYTSGILQSTIQS